ncbi:MAG: putative sulfate exporter family transporter [Bacillota bacterium]
MAKLPPKHDNWGEYLLNIIPGLALCFALGALARWLDANLIPEQLFIFNYVLIAILLGLIARNFLPLPPRLFDAGINFSARMCLYVGIVLLGARLNLVEIFSIGSSALIMVSISIAFCIALCGWFARRMGAGERWGHLVGVGIGVCGVSAIMAVAPAIRAREREIVTAIGAALLTDVMVLLTLPLVGHALGWGDTLAGFTAGVVPSNTAQCIAIGHAYSEGAGAVATIVKSARNALMPAVVLVLTYIYTRRGLPVGEKVHLGLLWSKFPKFIVGLMIAASLATLGLITPEGAATARTLSTWCFVTCFVGIGAGIDIRELKGQDLAVIAFGFPMTIILWLYVYVYGTAILML